MFSNYEELSATVLMRRCNRDRNLPGVQCSSERMSSLATIELGETAEVIGEVCTPLVEYV